MSHNNAKILRDGLEKGYNMIINHLYKQMYGFCERLLLEVPKHREYYGFTGNTQTSYACGIYVDGSLEGIVVQNNWNTAPLREKVPMNVWVYLRQPYEGRSRSVRGKVRISGAPYGLETSINFLRKYRAPKNKLCIIMTTGTEYSEFLEAVRNIDVLTGTYEAAHEILKNGWKKMDEG